MNVRSLLAVIVCLSGASVARAIPLYVQDFASGSTPQAYVSSTSTKNLLASLSSESAGGVWSIDATGALQLIRTSNTTANSGAGFTTLSLASTPPGMLSIKFDFGVKVSNSPTLNNAMRLEIGAIDSGDYNDMSSATTTFSRLNVGLHQSSFRFYMYPTQTPLYPANGALHRMVYVMNRSGTTQTYRAPDASVQTLQNGRMSLWMDGVALYSNFACINSSSSTLANIRVSFPMSDKATWKFDNIVVTDATVPETRGIPGERLAATRDVLRSGSTHVNFAKVNPAFQVLIQNANVAAPAPPAAMPPLPTVLDSGTQPALTGSVDRDYFSIGTYWTQNPADPDGPWINTPHDDHPENAYMTDEAAMRTVCSDVSTLCLAAYLTTDTAAATRYTQRAVDLMRAWFLDSETGMNPHLSFAACVPGDPEQTGRGAGIIDTVKLVPMIDGLAMISNSPLWTQQDKLAWDAWLGSYLDWLIESEAGLEASNAVNNHSTWYDAQIAHYALALGDPDLARQIVAQARDTRLFAQTWSSGKQPAELSRPQSLPYSTFNLRAMITLAQQAEWLNVDWWNYVAQYNRTLRKTIDFVAPYAVPGSNWALADSDSPQSMWGDRLTTRELLAIGASYYLDATFQNYLAPFATGGFTFTYDGVSVYTAYSAERWKLFAPLP